MATTLCPSCGTPNAIGAVFCQRCGRALGGPPPPPPAGYPAAPGWGWQGPAPPTLQTDAAAISQVQLFAILGLVGVVIGYVVQFGVGPFLGYSAFGVASTGTPTLSAQTIYVLTGILLLAVGFAIAGLWILRRGFLHLRDHDPRFSTPSSLLLVGIIGLIFLVLGFVLLLSALASLISCAGTTSPPPSACVNLGALLGGIAVVFIGAILALVGVIGGAVLGVWRVGERYDETVIKVGAILYIFPFLNIIALALILWGLSQARQRLQGGGAPVYPSSI